VERPGPGDDTRGWGPPWIKDDQGQDTSVAAYYLCANRNKRSITVDITQPEGQDIVRRLAAQSDVVLENFKLGGLKQYGLDYDSLKAVNPRLVYCSITGFGQDGPYAPRAGYDFLIQGLGGLMSITGRPDGEPGAGPMKVGVALTDILTGLYATNAVLAALAWREQSGEGQYIDMALLDVQVACLANQAMNYLATGNSPRRMGNAHPSIVPYQDFPTADGHMILAIGNDGQFARFCEVAGRSELAADARFATNRARVENRAELIAFTGNFTTYVIEQFGSERTATHAAALLIGALHPEGEYRPNAQRQQFFRAFVVRVPRQTGVVYVGDARIPRLRRHARRHGRRRWALGGGSAHFDGR